ncbi:AAA family ATPase [Natrinema versiforme]|uniref:MCM family protein n=1 Tax=Natrinema versiforme JCM 10478 TaxID=1227496 RepID=L9Y8G7_9EURY|nr:minichromosome maintenance protein MCM [Natrinema versiforme]ELY69951.1 MCM family protein [Natrinema versiforme JCM 10478]
MSSPASYTDCIETFYEEEYANQIADFVEQWPDEQLFWVEYADVATYEGIPVDDFLENPHQVKRYYERALMEYAEEHDEGIDLSGVTVRLTDSEGAMERLSISDLEADHIGTYIAVEGQLSKVTAKKPLLVIGAFECGNCGSFAYENQPRHKQKRPNVCNNCDRDSPPFNLHIGESTFVNQRKLKLETPPDEAAQAEGASTPVYVTGDLCDLGGSNGLPDRAGEQVTVLGERRVDETGLEGRNADPECDTWIDAGAIVFHGTDDTEIDIDAHREQIHECAGVDDPVTLFRKNIVPTLEADEKFETVLDACVAWLFGSYRVDQEEGQYRGDIHMGLIGDPGTGKSTLLSELAKIAPMVEYRSGTGLSEVGLTAAAIHEEFAGKSKWTLQPGIMPRANGGHCIIDEVDDVLDGETKAIHDALEGDQMVKIDKAGISADLETRTALLASGNPIHGRFNRHEPLDEQLDMDPALISRMDVLIDLVDKVDREADAAKADRYLDAYDEIATKELSDKPTDAELVAAERDVPIAVLRAWVSYAREEVFPQLTSEAKAALREFYLMARNLNNGHDSDEDAAVPVTLRTLGAGIRLATAFARCELSDTVEPCHAERAKQVTQKMIGLNWDPETGQFDAGITDTGDLDRWQQLMRVIIGIETEYDDGVPTEDVIEAADAQLEMSVETIKHGIDKLLERGAVYELSTGQIRTT